MTRPKSISRSSFILRCGTAEERQAAGSLYVSQFGFTRAFRAPCIGSRRMGGALQPPWPSRSLDHCPNRLRMECPELTKTCWLKIREGRSRVLNAPRLLRLAALGCHRRADWTLARICDGERAARVSWQPSAGGGPGWHAARRFEQLQLVHL